MAVNKLIVGGQVKFDLSSDTVNTTSLLQGVTAHNADGVKITGTLNPIGTPIQKTLKAGTTTLTFNEISIADDNIVDIYCDKWGISPENATTNSNGVLTLTFEALSEDVEVVVIIKDVFH